MSNTGHRRYSKNNLAYRVLENTDLDELQLIFHEMPSEQRNQIPRILPVRPIKANSISLETAELVKTAALRLYSSGKIDELFGLICYPLHKRSKDELGESFEHPTEADINQLTSKLISEFGPLRTSMFYAYVVDGGARASPYLLQYIGLGKPLEIPEWQGNDAPKEQPAPRPAPTEMVKQSRRERRQADRIARNRQKSHQENNRILEKRRSIQSRNKMPAEISGDAESPAVSEPSVIPLRKLIHPHISRFRKASGEHELTSRICSSFISFNGSEGSEVGKTRPCVIIAVAPKYFVVRPVFSNPYGPAGLWRAVTLHDWLEAGFDHQSCIGIELRMVWRTKSVLRGKLSLRDWNRICLGEIN